LIRSGGYALLGLVGACGSNTGEARRAEQPVGWDDELRVTEAVDTNPDPRIVELDLRASVTPLELVPGTTTPAWTYNGSLPGPLIRANVGDRVIVHFENQLPEATTIHWHGLQIPAAMDGMPGHSQEPVQPGSVFTYDFVVPDASTFWYHPHVHSAAQVGEGLYAPFVVDDPAEPEGLGDEVVMVLSDMGVNADGSLQPPDASGDIATLFGREGNLLLVNGKVRPTLRARPGLPQRWRVINAAKSRYFQLAMPGHSFTRIGGDGGLLSEPVDNMLPVLTPGERADLIVVPNGAPGEEVLVHWVPYYRGYGSTFNRPPEHLMTVRLEGEPVKDTAIPRTTRAIEPLSTDGATQISIDFTQQLAAPLKLGINGVAFEDSQPIRARLGETQVWTVKNTIQWAHPFHLHGYFFQVLDPSRPLEWKDTVDVPVDQTVRLVVRYDERPGMWMFHCHILDHADAGMMGSLLVEGDHSH
jgi:FtsP/CotA-like multicopper oxidase with cupredoxin domain